MDDSLLDPDAERIPLEQALEAVARRLAGVTAAVDGVAERQQDLRGRDYGEDLALIHQSCEDLRETIDALAQKPALALTPEMIGRQIEATGRQVRKDADLALAAVHINLQNAISALARITGSVRTVRQHNQWLAGAAGLALVLGAMGGAIFLPAIDWVVPQSWLWPEKRATSALNRNGWAAGERLLLVSDPERWKAIQAAATLSEANSGAIERCARRAADRKLRSVGCTVEVGARDY
ncbi:hypothetical protein BSY18_4164 (plasmid) [Blastomonas sp. RAC04]|uniref:DUF6118 family protein n=1 Tax=Blastomonas sp. RAC04 TaxID=1842535 RepID=UPI00083DEC4B|nr:DUF6118 family protein [Blastomonas sp. RAC04]AOG02557.1 hypothetical protein BSY18_4164 [Blastomonas sp. RAC04]